MDKLFQFCNRTIYTDFNVRNKPDTKELVEQKIHSLDPIQRWWHDCLYCADDTWPEYITTIEAVEGIIEFEQYKGGAVEWPDLECSEECAARTARRRLGTPCASFLAAARPSGKRTDYSAIYKNFQGRCIGVVSTGHPKAGRPTLPRKIFSIKVRASVQIPAVHAQQGPVTNV